MNSLVSQGAELAAIGMGTVFVFLTVLVFATTLMSKLVALTETQNDVTDDRRSKKMAAIAAAIHQHRNS